MQTQRTQTKRTVRWLSTLLLFGVIFTMALPSGVLADGTPAGSTISNTATITFSAGGGSPVNLTTPTAATFTVDRKVDVLVARVDATYTDVAPGQTTVALAFTVTNQGNANFDLALTASNGTDDPFSLPVVNDDFEITFPAGNYIYRETGGNPIAYDAGTDTATTSLGDLPQETPVRIYVLIDIPAVGVSDDDVAGVILKAVASEVGGVALGESVGPTGGMDTIFTDSDGDDDLARQADHSDANAVRIRTAYLSITKTADVIWDPVNNDTNPLAIPDAYVQYTITITHDGTVAFPANLTALSDTLATTLIFDPDLIDAITFLPESGTPGEGFKVTPAAGRGGGADIYLTSTNADADGAAFDGTDTITVDFQTVLAGHAGYVDGELLSGESVVLTFNVIID